MLVNLTRPVVSFKQILQHICFLSGRLVWSLRIQLGLHYLPHANPSACL